MKYVLSASEQKELDSRVEIRYFYKILDTYFNKLFKEYFQSNKMYAILYMFTCVYKSHFNEAICPLPLIINKVNISRLHVDNNTLMGLYFLRYF